MVYDNEQDSHLKPGLRWELGQRAEVKVASLVHFTRASVFFTRAGEVLRCQNVILESRRRYFFTRVGKT